MGMGMSMDMDMERTWTWMWTWTWGESRGGSKPGGGGERQGEEDEVSHLYAASKQTHLPSAQHTHMRNRAPCGRTWADSRESNAPYLACGASGASSTPKPYASSPRHAKTRSKSSIYAMRQHGATRHDRPSMTFPAHSSLSCAHTVPAHVHSRQLTPKPLTQAHMWRYILRSAAAANLLRRRCHLRADLSVHVAACRGSGPPFDRLRSQHAIGRDSGSSSRSSRTTAAMTSEAASASCDGCVACFGRACSDTRAHMVLAVVKGHARHAPCIAKPRYHHAHEHLRAWLAVGRRRKKPKRREMDREMGRSTEMGRLSERWADYQRVC